MWDTSAIPIAKSRRIAGHSPAPRGRSRKATHTGEFVSQPGRAQATSDRRGKCGIHPPDCDSPELTPVIDFFRDPNGYSAALPSGFRSERELEIVAHVATDVWSSRIVQTDDVTLTKVRRYGTVRLFAMSDAGPLTVEWTRTGVTFDAAPGAGFVQEYVSTQAFGSPAIPGIPTDVTLQNDGVNSWAFLYWNADYAKVQGGNLSVFNALTRDDIPDDGTIANRHWLRAGDASAIEGILAGDVLKIRTNPEDLPGKLYVESIAYDHNIPKGQFWCTVTLRYVIYEKP